MVFVFVVLFSECIIESVSGRRNKYHRKSDSQNKATCFEISYSHQLNSCSNKKVWSCTKFSL